MQPLTPQNPLLYQLLGMLGRSMGIIPQLTPTPSPDYPKIIQEPPKMPLTVPMTQTPKIPQNQPTPTGVDPSFIELLNTKILPVTRQYGIPDAVVAAQAAHESGYGKSNIAQGNNYFGLKAHSYPGFAHFDTPEAGTTYYAQTVKSLIPNLDQINHDPVKVLSALQSGKQRYEGDNPNPQQYVYDVTRNPLWKYYGGADVQMQNPKGWK